MGQFFVLVFLVFSGSALAGSVKIINEKNEALVERLGSYNKKLTPGLNFIFPFVDRIVYRETIRERVIDIPPQSCITKDNVAITVDAVVYWKIVDMEKAYYKVENIRDAMVNLVLTQIRAEVGKLELDETFTARAEINEILLRELDIATDPWGVKVTRVELRDIMPSKAVQESMELQMAAERKKRAAILNSEGERDAAINSAQGKAQARLLDAEALKKAAILEAEAERQSIILEAEAQSQEQILRAKGTAEAMAIITEKLKNDPNVRETLQFLLAQNYLDMGKEIGSSKSAKVLFMDPRSLMSTLEGIRSAIGEDKSSLELDIEKIDRHSAD
ncbi:SPFH/Band 7/PHB domain protein [Candidatus Gracilibacteria bacterium]|nr:SPFH/Band 7/PHB domain protein [Candidatus Gracilibacteria bacterium]NJM87262.1 SPFH/Band 7/PHB domain protein [Hydrococcus sp. RU_2_2]NJP18622.1 SPFH/Band 7/PHB domain protein [Hydrococcus sp. CRU_1_1]